ncbi:sodium:proton antiporter [Marinilabiliaceae bacterium JC017]|nr:sodium:proton antiporter [Marinilabiliaceae bacterium JC017]
MVYFYSMALIFVLGYGLIAFEHVNKIDKAAVALMTGGLMWLLLVIGGTEILELGFSEELKAFAADPSGGHGVVGFITGHALTEHLGEVSSIIFFLLGAMTIVEVVDRYQGFRIITDRIKTTNRIHLLWIVSVLTFFISALLDNLTTTIVMITLLQKLLSKKDNRWVFSAMVVIAANAGGAWSPMGDVTTIMLWIGGQVTAASVVQSVFMPSLLAMLVPLIILSFIIPGDTARPLLSSNETEEFVPYKYRLIILCLGLFTLVSVPVIKATTHLPPSIGMLFGLGLIWVYTDRFLKRKKNLDKRNLSVVSILERVDLATVLFFLGILLAVAAFQTAGHLNVLATWLNDKIGNIYGINLVIGFLSSVVDNVPLVAASMGMYHIAPADSVGFLSDFMVNGDFWTFLAYCSGTGGSMLIIGSAAGVAAMGLERIPFFWYLKRMGWLALLGYLAGALWFIGIRVFL